ncbi:inositol phospholipid biosynthesis protein scs3 [Lichtheimia corymbifera JMRC:FSU:9682]|uniref:Inositol phospholipid biosynthesis protein scs3 n=1 Tax=Lichtheimia corymbifera JMRC:FSU:9682 TaxID=1263082 RepID=A0A068RV62_9FUNG|nr:inositol phospholipid biosynthesis protein scs3 [Lichtheimia corymbifera JMRC:FSU:9682]
MPESSSSAPMSTWNTIMRQLRPHQKFAAAFYLCTVMISLIYAVTCHPPVNYFSNKRNLINVYFVKLGWLWTTIIYFIYLVNVLGKRQSFERGLARYVCMSLYWYLMTQWLLGPSFIDRVFVATGGTCRDPSAMLIQDVYQQTMCRRAGGTWSGGHDVSGHCVLLIHSSLFLWEEVSWIWYSIPAVQRLKQQNGTPWLAFKLVCGLLALWWWMLVITSVYFHGHYELFTGCIFGIAGWAALYLGIFPRIPSIRLPPIQFQV